MSKLSNVSVIRTAPQQFGNAGQAGDAKTSAKVRLGSNEHTVAPGKGTSQPVTQAAAFPQKADAGTIANAKAKLGVKSPPKPKKSYAFTYKQLEEISSGDYNVGEIALNWKGKLKKINNQTGFFAYKNTTVSSSADNARLRNQIYSCIVDHQQETGHPLSDKAKAALADILFGEGRNIQSLSRDELGCLLAGVEAGKLDDKSRQGMLKTRLEDIRMFKTGDWEKSPTWRNAKAALPQDSANDNEAIKASYLSRMKDLIKGLKTDPGNAIVSQVSANAKQDAMRNSLRDSFRGIGLADEKGHSSFNQDGLANVAGLLAKLKKTAGDLIKDSGFKPDGKICIHRDDFEAIVNAAVVNAKNPGQAYGQVAWGLENFVAGRVRRRDSAQTNPALALEANSVPNAKKTYIRQSDYKKDINGVSKAHGSNFCFFNSVINAVLANGKPEAQDKLKGLFNKQGFTLHDKKGEKSSYKYGGGDMSHDGSLSYYEQALNMHFKKFNGANYNYSAGHPEDAAKALGMKVVIPSTTDRFLFGVQETHDREPGKDPKTIFTSKDVEPAYVGELKENIKAGNFVTMFVSDFPNDSHFVAVKGIELLKNGSVKVSVVDDRPHGGSYEYDRTLTFNEFHSCVGSSGITVLEWPKEVAE